MMNHQEEKLVTLYLLGAASPDEQRQVEEKLLLDDEYADRLLVIEEELIDDYLLDALAADDRARFETYFMTTPKRRQKFALAKGLKVYAWNRKAFAQAAVATAPKRIQWLRAIMFPQRHLWKAGAFAVALLALTICVWQYFLLRSPVDEALAALDQAYRGQRPLESRITGFEYAPFPGSVQRGSAADRTDEKVDYIALERARTLLAASDLDRSRPAVLHALGQFFLAQKVFDLAIDRLRAAQAADPNNARIHSDLGAALLGKIQQDRLEPEGRPEVRKAQDLNDCLRHLNRAMEIDSRLLEPLFNRALLFQHEQRRRQALEDWNRYLQKDPGSAWAAEARQNLAAIETAMDNENK